MAQCIRKEKQMATNAHRVAVVGVDLINSFFEDGELPVSGASEIIKPANSFFQYIDACRAVDVKPGDGERAITKMKKAWIKISTVRKEISNV